MTEKCVKPRPSGRGAVKEPIYVCPECGSDRVTTEHIQTFMVYTGGHFSHIVKTHGPDSPATCIDCQWTGERRDLKKKGDTP